MPDTTENNSGSASSLALSMSGGGARAAYQVGLLRCLARHFPDLELPYITGISAGAINAAQLAAYDGNFSAAVDDLTQAWCNLTPEHVFRLSRWNLIINAAKWAIRLFSGRQSKRFDVRGLVDSAPLRQYLQAHLSSGPKGKLPNIQHKIGNDSLRALAISTTNYMTGQSITWTQGKGLESWEGINKRSKKADITVEHVMASAALPIFFPAIKLDGGWYGDGGIRMYAPLSPSVHMGADKILAISTRYSRTKSEEYKPLVKGYPPPAQIVGVVMNAVFLDLLDQDADRLEQTNEMLRKIPEEQRGNKRIIDLFILRPSQDLGKLAGKYEDKMPAMFKFLMRGQGVHEQNSPDWLSMILFQQEYLTRLIELGEKDAEARLDELKHFLGD